MLRNADDVMRVACGFDFRTRPDLDQATAKAIDQAAVKVARVLATSWAEAVLAIWTMQDAGWDIDNAADLLLLLSMPDMAQHDVSRTAQLLAAAWSDQRRRV